MQDVNSDKMIYRPVYSDRLRVKDVTQLGMGIVKVLTVLLLLSILLIGPVL